MSGEYGGWEMAPQLSGNRKRCKPAFDVGLGLCLGFSHFASPVIKIIKSFESPVQEVKLVKPLNTFFSGLGNSETYCLPNI